MRHRLIFLAVSLSGIAAAPFAGCGGDATTSTATATDGGIAPEAEAAVPDNGGALDDAGGDVLVVVDAANSGGDGGCDATVMFATDLSDADIADGGAKIQACIDCAQASCKGTVDLCNGICDCREPAGEMLECFVTTGTTTGKWHACESDAAAQAFALRAKEALAKINDCMRPKCWDACAPASGDAGDGGDGG